jgi:hypothetical protein
VVIVVTTDTVASHPRPAGSFAWLSVVLTLLAVATVGAGVEIDRTHPQPGRPMVAPLEQAAADTVVPVAVSPVLATSDPAAVLPAPVVAPAAPPPVVRPVARAPKRVVVTPRRVRPAPVVPATRAPSSARTSRHAENVGSDDSSSSDQRKHDKKRDKSDDSRSDGARADSSDQGQDGDTSS